MAVGVLSGECDREVAAYRVLPGGVVAAVPPLLGEGAEHEEGGFGEVRACSRSRSGCAGRSSASSCRHFRATRHDAELPTWCQEFQACQSVTGEVVKAQSVSVRSAREATSRTRASAAVEDDVTHQSPLATGGFGLCDGECEAVTGLPPPLPLAYPPWWPASSSMPELVQRRRESSRGSPARSAVSAGRHGRSRSAGDDGVRSTFSRVTIAFVGRVIGRSRRASRLTGKRCGSALALLVVLPSLPMAGSRLRRHPRCARGDAATGSSGRGRCPTGRR